MRTGGVAGQPFEGQGYGEKSAERLAQRNGYLPGRLMFVAPENSGHFHMMNSIRRYYGCLCTVCEFVGFR